MNHRQRSVTENRQLFHDINNRLNALSLAIGILQQNVAPDVRNISNLMEDELEHLHRLIEELSYDY